VSRQPNLGEAKADSLHRVVAFVGVGRGLRHPAPIDRRETSFRLIGPIVL